MNDNDRLEEELGEVRKAEPQNERTAASHDDDGDECSGCASDRQVQRNAQAIQRKAEVIQRFAAELKAEATPKVPAKKGDEVRKVEDKKAETKK